MRIVLASGDTDLRLAIQLVLSEEPGIQIIGSANNMDGLLALINSTRPGWVLMDWDLPGSKEDKNWSNIFSLKSESKIKLIALGRQSSQRDSAIQCGADEFAVIGDPPENLLKVIRKLKHNN